MSDRSPERRPLGSTGLQVSALGMGCGRLGSVPRPRDLRGARDAVSLALASGITFFDTADVYGRGLSEIIIGRAIEGRREDVLIATKCGLVKTPGAVLRAASGRPPSRSVPAAVEALRSRRTYEPGYVRRAAVASLRRLRRDHIDLFLLHSPPTNVLAEPRFVEAMETLQASGSIRSWGVSVRTAEDALLALALPGIAAIEIELSMCQTAALEEALPAATRRNVGVIARQPFGSGRILSAWQQRPTAGDTADPTLTERKILDACLAFALRTEGVCTVVAGMTKPEHVAANVAAALGGVSDAEITRVRAVVCPPG